MCIYFIVKRFSMGTNNLYKLFILSNFLLCAMAINLENTNFIYQQDISEQCRRSVTPSVFLGNQVYEANSKMMHFSRLDLPYNCFISVRTESGSHLILVVQLHSEVSLSESCRNNGDQFLVYQASETFGGYWAILPDELTERTFSTPRTFYTMSITKTGKTESITEDSDEISDEDLDENTTTSSPTTNRAADSDMLVMEIPLVNVSGRLFPAEVPIEVQYDTNEFFDRFQGMTSRKELNYETQLIPLLQFSPANSAPITYSYNKDQLLRQNQGEGYRYDISYNENLFGISDFTSVLQISQATDVIQNTMPMGITEGLSSVKTRTHYSINNYTTVGFIKPFTLATSVFTTRRNIIFNKSTKFINLFSMRSTFPSIKRVRVIESSRLKNNEPVTTETMYIRSNKSQSSDHQDTSKEENTKHLKSKTKETTPGVSKKNLSHPYDGQRSAKQILNEARLARLKDFTSFTKKIPGSTEISFRKFLKSMNVDNLVNKTFQITPRNTSNVIDAHSSEKYEVKESDKNFTTKSINTILDEITVRKVEDISKNITIKDRTKINSEMFTELVFNDTELEDSFKRNDVSIPAIVTDSSNITSNGNKFQHISTKSIIWNSVNGPTIPDKHVGQLTLDTEPTKTVTFSNKLSTDTLNISLKSNIRGTLLNHESWENIVQVAPEMEELLNKTILKLNDANITYVDVYDKDLSGSDVKKRHVEVISIDNEKPRNISKTKRNLTFTPELTGTPDIINVAHLIELSDDEILGRVSQHRLADYTSDQAVFNVCDHDYKKTDHVLLLNTSRVVLVITNFTIMGMTLIATSATTINKLDRKCPKSQIECQVSGHRVCIESSCACDGVPNCGSFDIYDEDKLQCGFSDTQYNNLLTILTFLLILLTLIYIIGFWLQRCVPDVSEAFFVYIAGTENVLYLDSIMNSPNDVESSPKGINTLFFDDNSKSLTKSNKLRDICTKCFKILKCKKRVEHGSEEILDRSAKKMYSFTQFEIGKMTGKSTVDAGVQTGDSLQMGRIKVSKTQENKHNEHKQKINELVNIGRKDLKEHKKRQTQSFNDEVKELNALKLLRKSDSTSSNVGENIRPSELPLIYSREQGKTVTEETELYNVELGKTELKHNTNRKVQESKHGQESEVCVKDKKRLKEHVETRLKRLRFDKKDSIIDENNCVTKADSATNELHLRTKIHDSEFETIVEHSENNQATTSPSKESQLRRFWNRDPKKKKSRTQSFALR